MPKKKFNHETDFIQALMNATLSPVTKRVYLERWKILMNHKQEDVFTILTHPKKYLEWIKATYEQPATQKSYISAVLAMFRHNEGLKTQEKKSYDMWYAAFDEIHTMIDNRYKKNEPTQKQVDGYVKFEEIVAKRDTLEMGTDERLLLSFYTYIPPLRCDLNRVRIYHGKVAANAEKNYIVIQGKREATLVLREFKTAQHMDPYENNLPKELVDEIQASLEKRPRDFLFMDRSGQPYKAASFTKWANRVLQKLFGRSLTISLIRHSYINSLDFNKLTVEEKERIAKDMAHTVATQDRYRLIFNEH